MKFDQLTSVNVAAGSSLRLARTSAIITHLATTNNNAKNEMTTSQNPGRWNKRSRDCFVVELVGVDIHPHPQQRIPAAVADEPQDTHETHAQTRCDQEGNDGRPPEVQLGLGREPVVPADEVDRLV